jgi:hypothetical protein
MKKWILLAAIVGFVVPIFWGVLGFIYFTAPQSRSTDLFWTVVHITCPFWDLASGGVSAILVALLNAGLYGLIVFGFAKLKAALRAWLAL